MRPPTSEPATGLAGMASRIDLSVEQFSALMERLPAPMWMKDEDGRYLALNDACQRMVGPSHKAFVGHTDPELFPTEVAERIRAHDCQVLASGTPLELSEHAPIEGVARSWLVYRMRLAGQKGRPVLGGMAFEITGYLRSEQALRESHDHYDPVVDGLGDFAIFTLDVDGRVRTWNRGAELIYGYPMGEILGKPASLFYPPDAVTIAAELEAATLQGKYETEGWRLRKNGSRFWAEVLTCALKDETGALRGFTRVSRERTDRKEAAEARRKNEEAEILRKRAEDAVRLRAEFLANMSHELRTPLNAIVGFSKLLVDGKVTRKEEQSEFLKDILSSGEHLLGLINGILDLAKVEAGMMKLTPERLDLRALAEEVTRGVRPLAQEKRIQLGTRFESARAPIEADREKVRQVFYNFLSNALKFTPEGGSVELRILKAGPHHFRIEVEDTGIGIKSEDIPRLFQQFGQLDASSTKRFSGTGLGLFLTKKIVESHGGEVGVKSTPGSGTLFFATLPRKQDA